MHASIAGNFCLEVAVDSGGPRVPRSEFKAQAGVAGDQPPAAEWEDADHGGQETTTVRRFREMLEFDARIFKQTGVRLLTAEARVLFYLSSAGPASVTDAMKIAGTSYRSFYDVLARLKEAGLVSTQKDAHDQRIRKLSVGGVLAAPPHP
jgi:hypothetical protein